MRVICFASGSSGNCTLVSDNGTHVLIDAGISMRRIKKALADCNLKPSDISAVLITHEHTDHVSGLKTMTKYEKIPIYAPRTVANHLRWANADIEAVLNIIPVDEKIEIGSLGVTAFHSSHDTDESVGYSLEGGKKLGYITDTGCVTETMKSALSGATLAVIEANHDVDMLTDGAYPYFLKRRVLSEHGHLSNDCCAELASFLCQNGAEQIILAHLSRENNRPELALSTVDIRLRADGFEPVLKVAAPNAFCVIGGDEC